jgi:DNA invertase Pin-like site-specific DNA recombinase
MLGVAAKFERRRIAERTARGHADAKAKSVKFGRRPMLTPHQQRKEQERLAAGERCSPLQCQSGDNFKVCRARPGRAKERLRR